MTLIAIEKTTGQKDGWIASDRISRVCVDGIRMTVEWTNLEGILVSSVVPDSQRPKALRALGIEL